MMKTIEKTRTLHKHKETIRLRQRIHFERLGLKSSTDLVQWLSIVFGPWTNF